jgi:hypothetical protein
MGVNNPMGFFWFFIFIFDFLIIKVNQVMHKKMSCFNPPIKTSDQSISPGKKSRMLVFH